MPILPKMTEAQALEFVKQIEIIDHSVTGTGGMDLVSIDGFIMTFRCFSTGKHFSVNLEGIVNNMQEIEYVRAADVEFNKIEVAKFAKEVDVSEHQTSRVLTFFDPESTISTVDSNLLVHYLVEFVEDMFDDEKNKHVSFGLINTFKSDQIVAIIRVASVYQLY